jgi:hypothetical protein
MDDNKIKQLAFLIGRMSGITIETARNTVEELQRFKDALDHDDRELVRRDCDCWPDVGRCYCDK